MKVAIFVHCFYPNHVFGTEAYTLLVAKNLQELGHEPIIVSAVFLGEPWQDRAVETYVWEGVKVVSIDKNYFPHSSLEETYYQPSLRNAQERVLRGIKPDIVHITHLINHTASIIEVAGALNIPVVSTFTDFFGFCYNNKLEKADGSLCSGPNYLRSNCVTCYAKDVSRHSATSARIKRIGKASRWSVESQLIGLAERLRTPDSTTDFGAIIKRPDLLRQYYKGISAAIAPSSFLFEAYKENIPEVPLSLSHFGIDIDRRPKPSRQPDEPLVFGFIGQLAPHKGVHLLVEAFRKSGGRNRLDIYGNFNQDANYVSKLRNMSAGLNVRFLGTFPSSETANITQSIDVLVIPSTWYENSPLILLQALATHTPCIVSNVRGMTEFVEDGVSGFYFERGDAQSLAKVMKKFVDEPDLAHRMSANTKYERTALDMAKDVADLYSETSKAWSLQQGAE